MTQYTIKVVGHVDAVNGVDVDEIRTYWIALPQDVTVPEWFETIKHKDLGHFCPMYLDSYR